MRGLSVIKKKDVMKISRQWEATVGWQWHKLLPDSLHTLPVGLQSLPAAQRQFHSPHLVHTPALLHHIESRHALPLDVNCRDVKIMLSPFAPMSNRVLEVTFVSSASFSSSFSYSFYFFYLYYCDCPLVLRLTIYLFH